jgi:hypothetical protein
MSFQRHPRHFVSATSFNPGRRLNMVKQKTYLLFFFVPQLAMDGQATSDRFTYRFMTGEMLRFCVEKSHKTGC